MMHLSYNKWLKQHPELAKTECPVCGGSGDEECEKCGHISDCWRCDGTGYSAKHLYDEECEADAARLEAFMARKAA